MNREKARAAIVGCGNIAATYVEQIRQYPGVELLGFVDAIPARAQQFADEHGGTAYADLQELLHDDRVELVINLTIHHAHVEIITRCLQADKHVYTEKPMAMSHAQAVELVELAERRSLRLGSAPITYMGEAQQTALQLLRQGKAGRVRVVYAEVNHGRIETWHPNPIPFYEAGILWDVGIYPLTVLTAFLGPVRRVTAIGKIVHPDRTTLDGQKFRITYPDFTLAVIEFEQGPLLRLTASFYARDSKQRSSVEFHGDDGMVYLGSCFHYNASVEFAEYGQEHLAIPLVREPFDGVEYVRGLRELIEAMRANRPHRASAEHAAHVVEVIAALETSMKRQQTIAVNSSFVQPPMMPWSVRAEAAQVSS